MHNLISLLMDKREEVIIELKNTVKLWMDWGDGENP